MHSWEDNIKMRLKQIGYMGVNGNKLAQNMFQWCVLANTPMTLRVT